MVLKTLYILEMIDEATKLISKQDKAKGYSFYRKALKFITVHEMRAAKEGKMLPGIINMLKLLKKRRIKVGIITRNCNEAVKKMSPNIENFCDVFIPRDLVNQVKPHPDHLALTLRKMSVINPSRCFLVGDHILDIEAGKRMGMKTVGVLTGNTTRHHFMELGADCILEDATKIMDYIFEEKEKGNYYTPKT
jgi:phosphoglycolate phosphatase